MADIRRNIGIPSGVVFPFAGSTAPYGYLVCDGRAISRTDYADLFMAIGTTYGIGDGATTFNLPDYRGSFLRGQMDVNTVTGSGTASSNNATFTSHGLNRTGFRIRLTSGTLSGLSTSTDYYAIVIDSNTLAFASSLANAIAGTKITISGANSAVLTQYEDPDYSGRVQKRQQDAFQGHRHATPNFGTSASNSFTGASYGSGSNYSTYDPIADGTNGSPRTAVETRPVNVSVNHIIKI